MLLGRNGFGKGNRVISTYSYTTAQLHNLSFVISSNEVSDINNIFNGWRPQIYHTTTTLVYSSKMSLQRKKIPHQITDKTWI